MKIYNLPHISFDYIQGNDIKNHIVDEELFKKIINKKGEIDSVQYKWDSAKKISNDYEYIFTSSKYYKNISSIIPVSRSFFKLREIIYDFQLTIDNNVSCIAEAPGGFIQSILKFIKERNIKSIKSINSITLVSNNIDIPYWNNLVINNSLVKICNGEDGTGDIYKSKNIINYIKFCGKYSCSFITADGGFDYTTNFEQELSSYKLFINEIIITLHIQSKGGTFICKLFDLFWYSTLQLVFILYLSYEKISFIKPYTSRQSNSEKYIICQGYKGYNTNINNLLFRHFENKENECLPIKLPDKFIELINSYHRQFINNQINRIDNTLHIINQRRNLDKPSKQQIDYAIHWCKKYKIPINKACIYLKNNYNYN